VQPIPLISTSGVLGKHIISGYFQQILQKHSETH
jgi:hypothetical protein